MGSTRVTVIDDSPELLGLIAEVLAMRGMAALSLSGVPTILELEESEPDLLLVDMRLHGVAELGCELVRAVRDHPWLRTRPVLVFATSERDLDVHGPELERLGVSQILPKPFSIDELEAAVDAALRSRVPQGRPPSGS